MKALDSKSLLPDPSLGVHPSIALCHTIALSGSVLVLEIQQIVATDEYATLRYTVYGTHLHDFHGIPPSNALITMPAMGLVRVEDSLPAEGWYVFDSGMLIMQSPLGKLSQLRKRD